MAGFPTNAHIPMHNAQQNWQSTLTNLHLTSVNPSQSPIFLQGLLGPTTRSNFIQLTRAAVQQPARFTVYAPNEYQLFTNTWNENAQIGPDSNDGSMLNSIATAITRWTEESKVLDGDSMHDCVANLRTGIIAHWEKHRDEELNERKEKRKEMIEKDRKNESQRAESSKATGEETAKETSDYGSAQTIAPKEDAAPVEEEVQASAQPSSQQATAESEQMEVTTVVAPTTSEGGSSAPPNVSSPEEVIEMTCSETISTEQEMEVTNVSSNQPTNEGQSASNSNEGTMNTPEATVSVDVSTAQQSGAGAAEQQGSTSASANTTEQQPSNSSASKYCI